MQIITLSVVDGKTKVAELPKEKIEGEHLQAIRGAEEKMKESFASQNGAEFPTPPPQHR